MDLTLDPAAFPNAYDLQQDANLGRLEVSTRDGDLDDDGDYDVLYAFGSRSISIFSPTGSLVGDSGDALAQHIASTVPDGFNSTNTSNDSFDARSDSRGVEPEAVAVAELLGIPVAFVGLERVGGIGVFCLADPADPKLVGYDNSRDFAGDPNSDTAGDLGPESMVFIDANEPMLAVAHQVSGSIAIYSIDAAL